MANFHCKFSVGFRKWGWWDEFWWTSPTGGLPECRFDCVLLSLALANLLDNDVTIESVVITQADEQGRTFPLGVSEVNYSLGGFIGSESGECNPPWLSLYMRMYDSNSLYARNWLFRGIAQDFLCTVDIPYQVPMPVQFVVRQPLLEVAQILTQNASPLLPIAQFVAPGGPQGKLHAQNVTKGRFCLRANDKTVGRQAALPIVGVNEQAGAGAGTSQWLLKVQPTQTFVQNEKIHVHGVTGQGIASMNGDATITGPQITAGANAGYWPLSRFDKDVDCTTVWNGDGVWWRRRQILVPLFRLEVGRVTRKRTGTPHYGTRGRAKANPKACNR